MSPARTRLPEWIEYRRHLVGAQHASSPLEHRGDALAAADAHRDQGVPSTDSLQFMHGLRRDDRARGTDGMPERDARAIGVDLGRIEAELPRHGAGLRSEGLV